MKILLGAVGIMFLVGCGSDPKSLASGKALDSLKAKEDAVVASELAIKFEGRTTAFPSSPCSVWLTLEEPGDQLLGKFGLSLHGVEAESLDLALYQLKDGVFYSPSDTAGTGGVWTLVGLASDGSQNPNDLAALKSAGELKAFFLLRLKTELDMNVFISSLEQSLSAEQIVDAVSLDVIASSFYEILHFNHYDNTTCEGFQLTAIEEVDFGHDSHSPEEESDHDHDHDEHDEHYHH